MSALTYHTHDIAGSAGPVTSTKPSRPSIWRRMYDAMVASQQVRAEREVANYLASHGGLLTDGMEREIMVRLNGGRGSQLYR
jgi:hypothetical protein